MKAAMRALLISAAVTMSVSVVLLVGGAGAAQEFSADLVGVGAERQVTLGKLNVAGGKVRLETPEVKTGFFLFLGDAAYFVRPASRIYMDAKQSSQLAQIFIPVDTQRPCDAWQAMAKISGAADNGTEWRCDRVGEETIGERDTTVVKAISPRQRSYTVWIDRRAGFPLRLLTDDGSSYRLERIEDKPQPASLFAVPPAYAKFDPQKLLERIKQSDVWVEPPRR
jgi:hypothetical protein